MNTKNVVAILMASIIAMAMFAPTAMATNGGEMGVVVPIEVPNDPPEVVCKCENPNPVWPDLNGGLVPVTICALVCDPNGKDDIQTVSATVYNPDGTVKIQTVPMSAVILPDTCDCDPLKPEIGQIAEECDRLDDPTCQLYEGTFNMDITQPGGDYRVVVTATDGELEDKLQNRLVFESVIAFDIDFNTLDFGPITICEPSYVMGDDVMEPPESDKPTIHNAGNDPIQIGIHFQGFKNAGGIVEPKIEMDARIPGIAADPNHGPEVWLPICTKIWFEHVLEKYCDKVPIDFSLHVGKGTPPGEYIGSFEIQAREGPHTILLEDKDHTDIDLYEPNLGVPNGKLTYDYNSVPPCKFSFTGYGLTNDPESYCLIYYPEPWNTQSGGCCLGQLNAAGTLTGTLPCIPSAGDWSYDRAGKKLAKIWLVPCSDYDYTGTCPAPGKLTGWTPSDILFDMETIQCC